MPTDHVPSQVEPGRSLAEERAEAVPEVLGSLPEWDLSDLYPAMDAPQIAEDIAWAGEAAAAFESANKGKLADIAAAADGGDRLAALISEFETIEETIGRLMSFSSLVYSGDTSDPKRAKFHSDLQDRLTGVSTKLLFFPLELNRIDDAVLDKALESPALAHFRPWLDELREERPYQLSDDLERLFHEKSLTGRGAWNRLFNETMSSLRFRIGGEELPIEPTLNHLTDHDEAKRKEAAEALSKTFRAHLRTFTLITNVLAKDKAISDSWRGFVDVSASRHLANRVEPEVVDALVQAVADAYPRISHRYYAMKAGWLGKDKLDYWDRNAPLPDTVKRTVGWEEAKKTVLDAYAGFDPRMAEIAGRFFDRNWIDAPTRPGKSPGAFAHPTVPSVHPYVLLNYQGKQRDVMTLAHELGHGVHQVLAGPQGLLMAQTPLTLAETASVFGEMLTFRSILDAAPSAKERKVLLAGKVEDMINTVVRQISFYLFERHVHSERREGEVTSERLGEIWMKVQEESLGPSIRLGEGYDVFWTYIPHFIHAPFYVYAYAFGDCLVNSLYAVYLGAESGFQERYFDMLKAGGTKRHQELLAPFGLDASDPAFWMKGLSVIEGLIDELEEVEAA
ncbi:M3 family oligoendopeptidase [Afifella sp. IM 167]|uniref:M3 family oligoendopeptidase n=1 Tax=Afifella sp. IM 167 TaxID=2033586 RepID=UPI001CCE657B|nr:M3 family oligoendopeptidase [Afifella sp. IM 167]MBZ8135332.1 oligoendopeptidase F [Afifella sp. IM 167]